MKPWLTEPSTGAWIFLAVSVFVSAILVLLAIGLS